METTRLGGGLRARGILPFDQKKDEIVEAKK
jgi:hypothetical protein